MIHNPSPDFIPVGAVSADAPSPPSIRRLRVVLIRLSKYDDQAYVLRFWRGVLSSNTLAVLAGLTQQVQHDRTLGVVRVEVEMLDETVQAVKRGSSTSHGITVLIAGMTDQCHSHLREIRGVAI
jgi:hypothetical protein